MDAKGGTRVACGCTFYPEETRPVYEQLSSRFTRFTKTPAHIEHCATHHGTAGRS